MLTSPMLIQFPNLLHGFGTKREDLAHSDVVLAGQVHGTEALLVRDPTQGELKGYDILITNVRRVAVGIKTADCLPILLFEPEKGIVAAVHAGWRGTAARIAEKAVHKIIELGGRPENLTAGLGPCIDGRCYEVGADVATVFQKEFLEWPEFLRVKSETKWLLDIVEANRRELIRVGVRPERIDCIGRIDLCTHCRPDLFDSYRRDGEKAGRMVSFIQLI